MAVRFWRSGALPVGAALLLLVAVAAGLTAVHYGLLIPLAFLLGPAAFGVGVFFPWAGLLLSLLLALLLPFGVLPLDLGVRPALLELALLGVLVGWMLPPLLRREQRWRMAWPDALAWAFVAFSLFSLLIALGRGVNATVLHNYLRTMLGVGAFFALRQVVREKRQGRLFLVVLLLGAGLAALGGIALHALPDRVALGLLLRLGVVGYPSGGRVLRYVEDDPEGLERAIGTSVDPNSFGGMLALAAGVALGEVLIGLPGVAPARRDQEDPLLPWPLLLVLLGVLLVALYLTYSRAALGGFVVAALFLAVVRYRRLWWGLAVGAGLLALAVGVLGWGGVVLERFRQGLFFQDLATQMRLTEYANALTILRRYPLLGIGFGYAPEVDLSVGVSSLYLTIAERMGLLGLAAFLALVGAVWVRALRLCREGDWASHRLALLAGLAAALSVGLLDHYFFNLEFPHMSLFLWSVLGMVSLSFEKGELHPPSFSSTMGLPERSGRYKTAPEGGRAAGRPGSRKS